MDPRQIRTREAIFSTLECLLEEMEYPAITVSILAHRANVGRPTFYRHFNGVDAVLQQLLSDSLEEQLTLARAQARSHDVRSWVELLATLAFRRAMERPRLFARALNGAAGIAALDMFQTQIEILMNESPPLPAISDDNADRRPYEPAFYAGAILGLMRSWLANGMQPGPADMGSIFTRLTYLPSA